MFQLRNINILEELLLSETTCPIKINFQYNKGCGKNILYVAFKKLDAKILLLKINNSIKPPIF